MKGRSEESVGKELRRDEGFSEKGCGRYVVGNEERGE